MYRETNKGTLFIVRIISGEPNHGQKLGVRNKKNIELGNVNSVHITLSRFCPALKNIDRAQLSEAPTILNP